MLVNGKHYRTVWFENGKVRMINQLLLPHKFEIVSLGSVAEVADAIRTMVVRGAPAIGAAGAYGVALACRKGEDFQKAAELLRSTRPTAHDLFHAVDFVANSVRDAPGLGERKRIALQKAEEYASASAEACRKIGEHGSKLIKSSSRIATHCNAGWLACVDWGTALSPMYFAKREGKDVFVWIDETRPRLQGAKLTAWEMVNERIPHSVIADNALGYYMAKGEVDLMIVGADRIASNGDFANKIGTYEKAVVAKENGIPFYVAAPSSTFDGKCRSGKEIAIEEREEDEVHFVGKERITPKEAKAKNPAFDVTPARLVSGVITENGIIEPGYVRGLSGK